MRPFFTRVMALALACGLAAATPLAHDERPRPTVAVDVVPDGTRMSVSARLPIEALMDANLPRRDDRTLDTSIIEAPLQLVARDLATRLAFTQGNDPLPFPTTGASLAPDGSAVNVTLGYVVQPGDAPLSARLQTYRSLPDPVAMVAIFRTGNGSSRAFTVESGSDVVTFNPTRGQVVRQFAARGIRFLASDWTLLLFLAAIAVLMPGPALTSRSLRLVLLAQLAGGLAALTLPASVVTTGTAADAAAIVGASIIVVTVLTGFAQTAQRFIGAFAVGAGLAGGVALGLAFGEQAVRAGDHTVPGLFMFTLATFFAQVWLLVLFTSVRDFLSRTGVPAQVVTYGALAYVCHRALHLVADNIGTLSTHSNWQADRLGMLLVVGWMIVTLVVATSRTARTGSVAL